MATAIQQKPLVENTIAAISTVAATSILVAGWEMGVRLSPEDVDLRNLGVSAVLLAAFYLCRQFPVAVRRNVRVSLGSIPLFLMATLLPPPVAALVAGISVFSGDLTIRVECQLLMSEIVTSAVRWTAVVYLGSLVANSHVVPLAWPYLFGLTGVVLWAGDLVTAPLLFTPVTKVDPLSMMIQVARESGLIEMSQYLVALLGALAAMQQIWALALVGIPGALIYFSFRRASELDHGTRLMLEAMADAVDLRDACTGGHSRRVAELVEVVLSELRGVDSEERSLIVAAARVHDIGKIGISDEVLNKPGSLTPSEREFMETHVELGADLLARYPDFVKVENIVRHHHEAWDGTGYPHCLKGTEIPLGSRVILVADSWDAMTSDRPYRRGYPKERAAAILREGRGKQWDPAIVDAFLRLMAPELPGRAVRSLRVVGDETDEIAGA